SDAIDLLGEGEHEKAAALFEKASLLPRPNGVEQDHVTAVREMIDELFAPEEAAAADEGITTGIPSLDRTIGGLTRGNVTVIAARMHEGKSSLAIQIALNAALAGARVYYWSHEM